MLHKKSVIGVKSETTQGTAATPAVTDYFVAEDVKFKANIELLERNPTRLTLGTVARIAGKRKAEISFKTELKASGTAGTAYAPLGTLFKACSMSETIVAVTSVTYVPISTAVANHLSAATACTVLFNTDGFQRRLLGAVGTWKFSGGAGKLIMVEFTLQGIYEEATDTALPSPTYLSQLPVPLLSATATLHSYAAIISECDLDINNEVSARESINAASGYAGFLVTGRKPSGSVTMLYSSISAFNILNKVTTNATGNFTFALGATAGNIITVTCPAVQLGAPEETEKGGELFAKIPLQVNESSGNDEISIAMT